MRSHCAAMQRGNDRRPAEPLASLT